MGHLGQRAEVSGCEGQNQCHTGHGVLGYHPVPGGGHRNTCAHADGAGRAPLLPTIQRPSKGAPYQTLTCKSQAPHASVHSAQPQPRHGMLSLPRAGSWLSVLTIGEEGHLWPLCPAVQAGPDELWTAGEAEERGRPQSAQVAPRALLWLWSQVSAPYRNSASVTEQLQTQPQFPLHKVVLRSSGCPVCPAPELSSQFAGCPHDGSRDTGCGHLSSAEGRGHLPGSPLANGQKHSFLCRASGEAEKERSGDSHLLLTPTLDPGKALGVPQKGDVIAMSTMTLIVCAPQRHLITILGHREGDNLLKVTQLWKQIQIRVELREARVLLSPLSKDRRGISPVRRGGCASSDTSPPHLEDGIHFSQRSFLCWMVSHVLSWMLQGGQNPRLGLPESHPSPRATRVHGGGGCTLLTCPMRVWKYLPSGLLLPQPLHVACSLLEQTEERP
jgi:hypothetical protein